MTVWPQIIVVNGPSSAGKSRLCRGLQAAIPAPFLCVGFDDFILFSAPRYYQGADTPNQAARSSFTAAGVQMRTTSAPGEPLAVSAQFGPVFRRLIEAMAPTVRTLVERGNAVIFDHVLHDAAMAESCRQAFEGLDVFWVGVTCPLPLLEARERARGDRVLGRARGLVDVVHRYGEPDLWLDTGSTDPSRCVATVLAALRARH